MCLALRKIHYLIVVCTLVGIKSEKTKKFEFEKTEISENYKMGQSGQFFEFLTKLFFVAFEIRLRSGFENFRLPP